MRFAPGCVVLMAVLYAAGCRAPQSNAPRIASWTDARRAAIYDRSGNSFASADFWKPPSKETAETPTVMFPLIVAECDADGSNLRSSLGRVIEAVDGRCDVDLSRPTVYVTRSVYYRRDVAYERLVFVWIHGNESASPGEMQVSGLRMTLDPNGLPIIWEVAGPGDDGSMVFVAESFEHDAKSEFGTALRGRRFSAEAAVEFVPDVVIARVLSDGPMPMGPFVYVDADRRISTVICRCMPSQAASFRETRYYEVLPLQEISDCAADLLPSWLRPEQAGIDRLDRIIRWPTDQ